MAGDMKKSVQWAINIANNNKYTYGWGMPPRNVKFGDYNGTKFDCSGFVSYALYHGGYYNSNQYPFSTHDEYNSLNALGFTVVPYSQVGVNNLKSGMIVWYTQSGNISGHTGIICGKNRLAEAYTDGVATAEQIRVTSDIDRSWQYVAYDPTQIDFDVGLWDAKSVCALLGNIWYEGQCNPQLEESQGQGGVTGYGVGLIQWSSSQSYQASWNMLNSKVTNGQPIDSLSGQLSAIEFELLTGDGSWIKTDGYRLTGEEFVTNSKNKSIEYLTKAYSYERREYGPRKKDWIGVRTAKELYRELPTYNKTIQEIGYQHLIKHDNLIGDFYGTNSYLPEECMMYNAKLIYDYLLSGSDRDVPYKMKRRKDNIYLFNKMRKI